MIDANQIGMLAALGSAASWSLGAVLFKEIGSGLSPFAMTLMKGGMSVLFLGVATLVTGGYADIAGHDLLYLSLSGILGIAVSDTFFFSALQEISPRALTLLFTFGQVLTALLAVLLLGEALPPQGWTGIALVITGIAVGMWTPAEKERTSLRGIAFGLVSMISMAVAAILTKKGLQEASTLFATFIRMLAGTAGMLLVGLATRRIGGWVAPFHKAAVIRRFALSVLVITFGGFWLATAAFKYTSVAVANSLIATEPIFILPLAALLLKEKITPAAAAGAVIATLGVVALCTSGIAI